MTELQLAGLGGWLTLAGAATAGPGLAARPPTAPPSSPSPLKETPVPETTTHQAPDQASTEHQHVFDDRWYPENRTTVRRVCVLPGCTVTERKEPRG